MEVPAKRLKTSNSAESHQVNPELCIICQSETGKKVTSSENGQTKIIEASRIRRDHVFANLQLIDNKGFSYHMSNDCYKRYTLKKSLDEIKRRSMDDPPATTPPNPKTTLQPPSRRSLVSSRDPVAEREIDMYQKKCVICSKARHKTEYTKYRISEKGRAEKFLKATLVLLDDVYTRTSDLQDTSAVFGADLFCHKECIRNYIRKGEAAAIATSGSNGVGVQKMRYFDKLIQEIDHGLNTGKLYNLSYLSGCCNRMCEKEVGISFTNRDIKMYLINKYGEEVSFIVPEGPCKPTLVFKESAIQKEPVETLLEKDRDIFKEAGLMLRQILLDQDFNLQNKFCDANELEEAYKNITIPNGLSTFLSALFDFDPSLSKECENTEEEAESELDLGNNFTSNSSAPSSKHRKLLAVYQILFYIINNGRKRTPLHMMISEVVYSTCKSKTLISSLNHFGLAVSYDELLRYHTDMASFINEMGGGKIPLPSNFYPNSFTLGAFDNFDHEEETLSGIGGSHDTVLIVMQDKLGETTGRGKPNVSETNIVHGPKQFKQKLVCQEIKDYVKPAKKPVLPTDYEVPADLFSMAEAEHKIIKTKDAAWVVSRLDLSILDTEVNEICENQEMPSWNAFNSLVTKENITQKIIGFLPVIPHPVTEYSTVYTCLKNFQDVLSQLGQSHIPVTCDEGVYHIAREIMMTNPREFNNIILCLGSFHMIKVVMGAIGKFIDGSGSETILTETKVFGKNVVKSVLSGSHYTRAMKGLLMLAESIERLQWSEFFKVKGVTPYVKELTLLRDLKHAVSKKDGEHSKQVLKTFIESSSSMMDDFGAFKEEYATQSDTFNFWNTFTKLVAILKDLVRADREGNWPLHLQSVQTVLPLFAACDRTNYLRWASVYLEDMRKLPEVAPVVHDQFMAGKFVVKRTPGQFNAIGVDMCLEQTINRSQKSTSGIIGSTKKKQYVTRWEMIYHEMLAVVNLYREISGVTYPNTEVLVNSEFSASATKTLDGMVTDMITYIKANENPVSSGSNQKLHNILTQEIVTEDIRKDLLQFETSSTQLYQTFRTERFIDKKKTLFDTIHRRNLKTFRALQSVNKTSERKEKDQKKELTQAQKIFDIARVRDYDIRHILQHDLVDISYLFDGAGLMKKPTKSDLCIELEKKLNEEDYLLVPKWVGGTTAYMVDVMAWLRHMRPTSFKNFDEFCTNFVNMINHMSGNAQRIDYIFDTYLEDSVKGSERIRRSSGAPIDINVLTANTPVPISIDSFWASSSNKVKLQKLVKHYVLEHAKPGVDLVASGTGITGRTEVEPCMAIFKDNKVVEVPDLDIDIEEADVRLLPHVFHSVTGGATRVIVLSNDTDVLVLLLHFWAKLKAHGLQELWMRAGVAKSTRYLPVHILAHRLGEEMCKVLPAVHQLTGCDTTSKFGSKAAGLKARPEIYLKDFGKDPKNIDIQRIEEYLVQVYKPGAPMKTLDELRYHLFHHSKKTIIDLPPTSRATEGHILRAFHGTYLQIHCLDGPKLEATHYGYFYEDGLLKPCQYRKLLPDDFPTPCKCKTCGTMRCPCRNAKYPCCPYCSCQSTSNVCRNPTVPVVMR